MYLKLERGQVDIFQVGHLLAACNYKQHVISYVLKRPYFLSNYLIIRLPNRIIQQQVKKKPK